MALPTPLSLFGELTLKLGRLDEGEVHELGRIVEKALGGDGPLFPEDPNSVASHELWRVNAAGWRRYPELPSDYRELPHPRR